MANFTAKALARHACVFFFLVRAPASYNQGGKWKGPCVSEVRQGLDYARWSLEFSGQIGWLAIGSVPAAFQ
jgi:hypothetical protein